MEKFGVETFTSINFYERYKEISGKSAFNTIESTWFSNISMSDNYEAFKKAILEGASDTEAALWTATGKW
jgi:hypothetical protein